MFLLVWMEKISTKTAMGVVLCSYTEQSHIFQCAFSRQSLHGSLGFSIIFLLLGIVGLLCAILGNESLNGPGLASPNV